MASKKELLKAQKLGQKMHDLFEEEGFSISSYGETGGPRCYIGGGRTVANIGPRPDSGLDIMQPGDVGDGPELTLLLEALDRAAVSSSGWKLLAKPNDFAVGRAIEHLGLQRGHSKQQALHFLRKALTDIYNQLEAK